MDIHNLLDIREYDGSQHRAWEELAYQLRDEMPQGATEVRKTKAPDGGVEWYVVFEDGHQEGYQAKFYQNLSSALGDMKGSVETVAANRPAMLKLTFVVPFDLTDHASAKYESDQDRWDQAVARWQQDVLGADRLDIRLFRGGDVLDRLVLEVHAGRRAFWFGELEFARDWFEQRLTEVEKVVGPRYTPAAHTELEIEAQVAAVAMASRFDDQLSRLVQAATDELTEAVLSRIGDTEWITDALQRLLEEREALSRSFPRFDPSGLHSSVKAVVANLDSHIDSMDRTDRNTYESHRLTRALTRADDLDSFLGSLAVASANRGVLGVYGPAGQGKTHLVLRAAREMLANGAPVIVVLGQRFSSTGWWPSLRDQLGLGAIDADRFLGALAACAEASGRRAVICVDALNESQDPRSWRAELPALIAHLSRYPWISLIITWKTEYAEILFEDGASLVPNCRHPGLAGVEDKALAKYCELYGIPEPEISTLDPAFSNPLFLRMYCEIRAADPSAGVGSAGRSQIFDEYVRIRSAAVRERLQLSPASDAPERAVVLVADQLALNKGRAVSRDMIELTIDALAPDRTMWPDTLFGTMTSVGLIEMAPSYEGLEVVGFPFQAFSNHLVVSRILQRALFGSEEWRTEVMGVLSDAPVLWSAAAVQLPELHDVEFVDVLPGDEAKLTWSCRSATLRSLVDRRSDSFGVRARELLEEALADADLLGEAHSVILELAPRLNHPCNARWLHESLKGMSMPDRDASWGIDTFDIHEESSAFDRLIQWAAHGGDAATPDSQILLAAVPLLWTLISSNRRLRDHTTKVLVELLRSHLVVARDLLVMSRSVDDVYLTERILLVAYGCLMRDGESDLGGARLLAEEVLSWFEEKVMPIHVLARDAGRGAIAWAVGQGLVDSTRARIADPPYGSEPPGEPPLADVLESTYGRVDGDPPDWRCTSILNSCLTWMGDFHKYVVGGDVGEFSWYPLDGPRPSRGSRYDDPRGVVDANWAGRWVAANAIGKGWTPERFAEFESSRSFTSGRKGHKPERFGKKYQWQALHELLARLADNFHRAPDYSDVYEQYEGPWRWFGRDLDPSLAPSQVRNDELTSTVGEGKSDSHWLLPSPVLDLPVTPVEWAADVADVPSASSLAECRDDDDTRWTALYRHSTWSRPAEKGHRWEWDRQQWVLQFSWLLARGDGERLYDLLSTESLFGRWMPEHERPNRAYLGEGPWSPLDKAEPPSWETASRQYGSHGIPVLPASVTYVWEGGTQDCSIDESVSFDVPTSVLLAGLSWDGTEPEWSIDGAVVIRASRVPGQHREHTVLLARGDWLAARLAELELELVVGYLAERQASDVGQGEDDLRAWTEISGAALWTPTSDWSFGEPSVTPRTR